MTRCEEWEHGRFRGAVAMIAADTRRYLNRSPESRSGGEDFKHLASAFANPQVMALAFHRFAHCLELCGWRGLATLLTRFNASLHRVTITSRSCLGPGCLLPHPPGISFAGTAGSDLTLYSLCVCAAAAPSPDPAPEATPTLGDRVSVGGHAVVIGPISVGSDSKIAYAVRVDRDVPAGMLVVSAAMRVNFESARAAEISLPPADQPC